MSVIPFPRDRVSGPKPTDSRRGVDTHVPRRVDSPDDTVSSWTNRRKDLRVIRPAAATAGFFLLCRILPKDRLQFDRRRHAVKCFALALKKIVAFAHGGADSSGGVWNGESNFRSLDKLFEFFRKQNANWSAGFDFRASKCAHGISAWCIRERLHLLYSTTLSGHRQCGF